MFIKPDFLSLAHEIAEPRPDMNIKVAAFTVSEKSSNTKHALHQANCAKRIICARRIGLDGVTLFMNSLFPETAVLCKKSQK